MKKFIILTITLSGFFALSVTAQEKYNGAFNVGLGIGGYSNYYGNTRRALPVLHLDYELAVAKNFTLAPFISFYTYADKYYDAPSKYYNYRQTVIPIGVKGFYYFDDILNANSKWDFYLGGSLGFAIVSSRWDQGYNGDRNYFGTTRPLFLDLHLGTEYHFNNKIGAFLDLSTGVSTIGLSFH